MIGDGVWVRERRHHRCRKGLGECITSPKIRNDFSNMAYARTLLETCQYLCRLIDNDSTELDDWGLQSREEFQAKCFQGSFPSMVRSGLFLYYPYLHRKARLVRCIFARGIRWAQSASTTNQAGRETKLFTWPILKNLVDS
jgi:hypothetical protein